MFTIKSAIGSSANIGVTLFADKSGATFRVWAPHASSVNVSLATALAGPFTPLSLSSDPAQPGYWSADISGVAAGHFYQFVITNRGGDQYDPGGLPFLKTDPCARQVTASDPKDPAVVVDPDAFPFQAAFNTPSFENFIIYQAHVGSFAGRGDGIPVYSDADGSTARFDQIESKLDYIASMKFNAVQFLPTGEYRGSEGEAYNPSNYFAPETLYGTPDQLRHLIDACHSRGLAVFFDVVYNHMDGGDNLWQFDGNNDHRSDHSDATTGGGIYFSPDGTDYGRRPDHDSPDVQRFFIENASMWIREYRADGLRFDSAVNFSEGGLKAIVQAVIARFPDKFIYAEDSDPGYIFGQIGFRACWDMGSTDDFARAISNRDLGGLRNIIARSGYPHSYSAIKYVLGSHDQIFNQWKYDNQSRQWMWDKGGGGGLRENRYFVERIGGALNGRDNWYARAQARLGWALSAAMPCTPMLFMGTECHHYGYWDPANDPFGDHRFDWSIAGDPTGQPMRDLVRDANNVRWHNDALRSDNPPEFTHWDQTNGVLAFRRWSNGGNVVLVVVNLGDNQWDTPVYQVSIGYPGDHWGEIFNSQAPQYGGWNDSGNYLADLLVDSSGNISIRLPKWSVLVFERR